MTAQGKIQTRESGAPIEIEHQIGMEEGQGKIQDQDQTTVRDIARVVHEMTGRE